MVDQQRVWNTVPSTGTGGGVGTTEDDLLPTDASVGGYTPSTGGSVAQAAGQVADAASQKAHQAKQAVGQAAQQAGDAAAPVTAQVQQTAGQVAEQAKQQALTQMSSQKEHAAGSLDAVAQALRQSGDQLRGNQQEPLANLASSAAQHVEQFSGYLRNTDINAMIRDVEQFARRQPAAFIGGAFTLGVLAARFLKSSNQNANTSVGSRTPSYTGYPTNSYATSGISRYPTPMPPTFAGSLGSVAATPSRLGSDVDRGAAGIYDSPSGPGDARLGSTISERTLDPSGITTATAASSTPPTSGWGYTPRSGTSRMEREGR